MEFENRNLENFKNSEYRVLQGLQEVADFKGDSEIGNTLILDGNEIINTEAEINFKKEVPSLDKSNIYEEYKVGIDAFETEDFLILKNEKYHSVSILKQSVDIKDGMKIENTFIPDRKMLSEIEINIKKEVSMLESRHGDFGEDRVDTTEIKNEEFLTLDDEAHIPVNDYKQSVDFTDKLEIEDTLILDGSKFPTHEEVRCNIKRENSAMQTSNNEFGEHIEGIKKPSTDADEDWKGIPNDFASTSAQLKNQCQFCDFTARYPYVIKRHIDAFHSGSKPYKCQECNFSSTKNAPVKLHVCRDHHKFNNHQCKFCICFKEASLERNNRGFRQTAKSSKCEYCDYTSSQSFNLKRHIETVHHNIKDIKCEYCNYTTSHDAYLKKHIRCVHLKIRKFKCEHCDYSAAQAHHLKLHIKVIHHKIKDIHCAYCDFTTAQVRNLEKHIKSIHQKIKDIECDYCDFCTSDYSNLKRHMNSIHQRIKNYECEYCNYSTTVRSSLRIHIKGVHLKIRDFKCEHCNYSATQGSAVKAHMITVHQKIKGFKC